MSESFAELFEKSESTKLNTVVKGVVVSVDDKSVIIDTHSKSESIVPVDSFKDAEGNVTVQVGDEVDVVLKSIADDDGSTVVSRDEAKRVESWSKLEEALKNNEVVVGVIEDKVKGGFTVSVEGIRAFLPGSLVDVRPVRDTSDIEKKPLEFKVIKLDQKRNNVVVSRRAVIETEHNADRQTILGQLEEGQVITGVVKNLTDYGAFVDLGGIDGLLHITDMAWKRVKHPGEVVSVGQEIEVKVLKFDKERSRVSLGLKQLGPDPWANIAERYPANTEIEGTVTNLADYGCFVEIEEGVEGLVHVSEMDWTNKNVHPSKFVSIGEKVRVKVLDIDPDKRRISLGLKQCKPNPWKIFSEQHKVGEKITGIIKSVTEFGMFVGLEGGIDGLVHLKDISSSEGEKTLMSYKEMKGKEVTAVITSIEADRERVSLGIRQLEEEPFSAYAENLKKGSSVVTGTIKSVTPEGAVVALADDVEGYIRAADASTDNVDDATTVFAVGDSVEAVFLGIDRREHKISLSVRAKARAEEKKTFDDIKASNKEASKNNTNAMQEAFKLAKGE